jgi:tetratricopeptide (TPR) repeat protein
MSTTLNLVDHLLSRGRHLQEIGREQDALSLLERLAGFRQLPPKVAEETQVRLSELLLDRGEFESARRHLTAALLHRPFSARYHFLMASALEADDKGDDRRALEHYRLSLEIEGDQPECLGEAGLLALRLGKVAQGLRWLRRAVELAPDKPEVVARLVDALSEIGRTNEARLTLRAAMFRNHRDSRFRKLWTDFHFHELREEQETLRQTRWEINSDEEKPVFLPFLRPVSPPPPAAASSKRVRRDSASPLPSPHSPRRRRLRKHAQ